MPPKSKNNKAHTTNPSSEQLTEFELYKNSAGQMPNVIVNLIKPDLYERAISQLREILASCRDSNKLISFKVRSPAYPYDSTPKDQLPTFLMQGSSLYILGYKIENNIEILKDADLRYSSTGQYSFYDLRLKQEDYDANKMVLHTVGYIIAEAVRSKEIERSILQIIIKGQSYSLTVTDSVFRDQKSYDLKQKSHDSRTSDLEDSFDRVENVKIADIKGDWEHESYLDRVPAEADLIGDYYRQMIAAVFVLPHFILYNDKFQEYISDEPYNSDEDYSTIVNNEAALESEMDNQTEITPDNDYMDKYKELQTEFAHNFKPLIDIMHSKIGMFCNALFYEGSTVKALPKVANGTSQIIPISAGIYQESAASSFKYSKIPGSERAAFGSSDNKPDDNDKGGGAIRINEDKENQTTVEVNTWLNYYLSWINQLPQWLQSQILNSTPIKTLIELTKRDLAIYESKSIAEDFYDKILFVEQEKSQNDFTEDKISEKAQVDDTVDYSGMIDMSMILPVDVAAVSYLILPILAESSVLLPGKDSFLAGESGLNLLNGIDVL